jgi:hypothetical protein
MNIRILHGGFMLAFLAVQVDWRQAKFSHRAVCPQPPLSLNCHIDQHNQEVPLARKTKNIGVRHAEFRLCRNPLMPPQYKQPFG